MYFIRWWCWDIATDEREVDYWKIEVVEFCFYYSSIVDFNVKVKVKSRLRLLIISSILSCKLIWIGAMHIITDSIIVQ